MKIFRQLPVFTCLAIVQFSHLDMNTMRHHGAFPASIERM